MVKPHTHHFSIFLIRKSHPKSLLKIIFSPVYKGGRGTVEARSLKGAGMSVAVNPVQELNDLHFQLAALYRDGVQFTHPALVEEYWADVEMLEGLYGPVGGWFS